MGLPSGSLSQARRVTIYSGIGDESWSAHLDVDEVLSGGCDRIAAPIRSTGPNLLPGKSQGFAVMLDRCDRIQNKRLSTIAKKLKFELGTIYRKFLSKDLRITVNGEAVKAIDPLFLDSRARYSGALPFGDELHYELVGNDDQKGKVTVKFAELPVLGWHRLPNGEKRAMGLTGGMSVSILRADREIDRGWILMGAKRRENYDDWWRCEISFEPVLDEWFGITNSKQGVSPSEELAELVGPDLEAIARALNSRVRKSFEIAKTSIPLTQSETRASQVDHLLPRIRNLTSTGPSKSSETIPPYRLQVGTTDSTDVFEIRSSGAQLDVVLNARHPLYRDVYLPLATSESPGDQQFATQLGLMILASARAERGFQSAKDRELIAEYRHAWSDILSTFLNA
jgi:hypothetical protein